MGLRIGLLAMAAALSWAAAAREGGTPVAEDTWKSIEPFFTPPEQYRGQLGAYRSPLLFDDGRRCSRMPLRRHRRAR